MELKVRSAVAGLAAAFMPLSAFGLGAGEPVLASDAPSFGAPTLSPRFEPLTLIASAPTPVVASGRIVVTMPASPAVPSAEHVSAVTVTFDHPASVDACNNADLTVIASQGCDVVHEGAVRIRTGGAAQ